MRLLVTNLFLSSFSLSVQPQEKCEAVSCGGGQWGKVHDSIRTLSPRCPVLGHRASGAPAEPPAPWDAPSGRAEVMQSWGVIPDLPAPILSLSHSPKPFITIINPANGQQHFLPKQMNPHYPHLSRFMPNLGALLPISRCLEEQTPRLAPSGDVSILLSTWVPRLTNQTHILHTRNGCCGLLSVVFDEPREGKAARLTRILLS